MGDLCQLDEREGWNGENKSCVILWTPSSVKVMRKGMRDGQRDYWIYAVSAHVCAWGALSLNSGERKRRISAIWMERVERPNERFLLFVG